MINKFKFFFGKKFLKRISISMNKKIKKLTRLESLVLDAVINNGVAEEYFQSDKKRLKAFYRALKKLKQIENSTFR